MGYHALITLMLLILISGCASNNSAQHINARPALMTDIYAESVGQGQKDVGKFVEENLKEQKTFGYVKPYIPVIEQPVVRKVWIPDHKSDQDTTVLVGGHWVYVMLEGPKWFIEQESNRTQIPIIVPGKPMTAEVNQK